MTDRRRERLVNPGDAVTGWAARALGGGDPAKDARELRRLVARQATGGRGGRGEPSRVGETVYVPHDVNTGTVASTTSTTTFAEHLRIEATLDAGTWDVLLLFSGTYRNTQEGGGIVARVSQPGAEKDVFNGSNTAGAMQTFAAILRRDQTSDGTTPIVFRADYRANVAGGTLFAHTGMLLATCIRKP